MNNNLKIEQIHKIYTEMLVEVTEFLDKYKIKYCLSDGTLIGAVRHKGFIPWDDDIDLSMSRPEYEKLIKYAKDNKCKISDNLYITEVSLNNSVFPYCKIVNKKYKVKEKFVGGNVEEYLWIDVFPTDGLSNNMKQNQKIFKRIFRIKKVFATRLISYKDCIKRTKNIFLMPLKVVWKFLVDLIPAKIYSKRMRKLATRYDYESADIVQRLLWVSRLYEPVGKEHFENRIDIEFENYKFKTFKDFDKELKIFYGDYMKLPPEDQRTTHLEDIWEIKDEK